MNPTNWSPDSVVPPLKRRLKNVLAPVARQAMPTVARIAGSPLPGSPKDGFVLGYRSLEREFPEADSAGNGTGNTPPTKAAIELKVEAARRAKSAAGYLDQLARGASLDASLLGGVRQLIKNGERHEAVAIGHSLREQPGTRNLGSAILGASLLGSSGPANAWTVFEEIANTSASEPVADELYAAAFGALGTDAAPILHADLESGRVQRWDASTLLHVAQKALARGLDGQARTLIDIARQLPNSARSNHINKELARLSSWLPEGSHRAEIPVVAGTINYGIMGYEQPDVTSRNIGDYIQSVASMGHIVRQRNFVFDGDANLVEFANELRATAKTERMVDGPSAKLNLLELNRDGNPYQALPDKTWALTFGWYMHHTFNQGYGIPFHPNLRPVLLSVYVRYPDMLTPEAVDYLRKYAPVGCRDWQTVALLRAAGIPAFFSGCLTTTIDTVFRRDGADTRDQTIYVDAPKTGPGESRTQAQTGIRSLSFVENLRLARDWVSHYHLEYNTVVTSRLHCFLPARSVGSQVTFLPKNRSDNRFGGLIDTTDEEFDRIRNGILDKASTMLQTIASGVTEEEVYATWREICAPAMAEADEYLASASLRVLEPRVADSILQSATVADEGTIVTGANPSVKVVIDARRGELKYVPALIRSIAAHTDSPVAIWIAADGSTSQERAELESADLSFPLAWITPDESALASLTSGHKRSSRHEVVLALAAEAVPGSGNLVFLPASAMVRSDIASLAAQVPSADHLVTAANDQHRGHTGGLELFRRVASRQGKNNQKALELVFATHRLRPGNFATFDPNVMVLNLDLANQRQLGAHLVPLILDYGMSFREALNTVVGPDRDELDRSWNHAPGCAVDDDPSLVNWRDTSKPWSQLATPFKAEWSRH